MILITGGAGYLGSCFAWACVDNNRPVLILDDLSTGVVDFVPPQAKLVVADAGDRRLVETLCRAHGVKSIAHFAASVSVSESIRQPEIYYRNNTEVTFELLRAAADANVDHLVFSSTAAVYGQTDGTPVSEMDEKAPISPYGSSKLLAEQEIARACDQAGVRFAILRNFNVSGADPLCRAGPLGRGAANLFRVCADVATRKRGALTIHGTDYPTSDGTAVRDYIHVSDLTAAHLAALSHLEQGGGSLIVNCGNGAGSSVREVVSAFEHVLRRQLPLSEGPRRPGDAASVVADSRRIREHLGWAPTQASALTEMARSELEWARKVDAASFARPRTDA